MFKIFRGVQYFNTNHASDGNKVYELEAIKLHDGKNVLAVDRWLADKYGSNSSLDYGYEKGLPIESDLLLKRNIDLSLKAFIIKEKVNTYSYSDKGYVLYLHVSVFENMRHKQEINEGLGWLYDIYYNDSVYFKNMIKKLRDESSTIERTIRESAKQVATEYNIKRFETLVNNIKRNIKKYQATYEKESQTIKALKETLKNETI